LEETTRTTADDLDEDGAERPRLPQAVTDRRSRPGPEPTSLEAVGNQWRYALVVVQAGEEEEEELFITAIFPGGSGLVSTRMSPFWILLELRALEAVVRCKMCKAPVKMSLHQQTNTQFIYWPDALSVAQPKH